MDWDAAIGALRAHGGVARVEVVAAAAGCTRRTARERARAQGWWSPFPGVLALPGLEDQSVAWARAAIAHARGRTGDPARDLAALCGSSALHLLGVIRAAPSRVEVVIPPVRWLTAHPRIKVVRSTVAAPSQIARRAGVPVLRGPALLRQLSRERSLERLRADAIDLQRYGWLDIADLRTVLETEARFPGRPALMQVWGDLSAVGRVDSSLEFAARRRFRAEGIEFDAGQVVVPTSAPWPLHVDLGIAALRFGIEVDSLAFHSDRDALERDAARSNAIAMADAGWRILHLTWNDLGEGWSAFVAMVRQVLEEQSVRFGVSA